MIFRSWVNLNRYRKWHKMSEWRKPYSIVPKQFKIKQLLFRSCHPVMAKQITQKSLTEFRGQVRQRQSSICCVWCVDEGHVCQRGQVMAERWGWGGQMWNSSPESTYEVTAGQEGREWERKKRKNSLRSWEQMQRSQMQRKRWKLSLSLFTIPEPSFVGARTNADIRPWVLIAELRSMTRYNNCYIIQKSYICRSRGGSR